MSPIIYCIFFFLIGSLWWFITLPQSISSSQNFQKDGRKLPPGPRGLPIIGNLHMLGNLPHRNLNELAKKYGPIMSLWLGNVFTIIVSSPQAAELFLKTNDSVFASRPKVEASKYMAYGAKGLAFTEYGPYWRSVRKFCKLELLSTKRIESLAAVRRAELGLLVDSLKNAAMAREVVDVTEKVSALIEDMTYRMLFGHGNKNNIDLKAIIKEGTYLAGAFNLADYVPLLRALDLQGLRKRMRANSKVLDKMLEIIIDEHEQDANSGHQKRDTNFIDVMLSWKNKSTVNHDDLSFPIDRTNIKAIAVDMILGAIDTSQTSIEWVMSELIRHPKVMKRLRKELETVVGVSEVVEERDLAKLDYLNMVIKESQRLHPVAPLLIPRESMEDIVIDGYYIPRKSRIIVNSWALGRDPNVWSESAEDFFPERFVGSNIDLRGHDFELIPFGSGRRGCPGMHLGLINIKLVVAQLVHCFEWVLPNDMLHSDLDMAENFGLSMPRAKHLLAVPVYRI